jgi:hypothetical protein
MPIACIASWSMQRRRARSSAVIFTRWITPTRGVRKVRQAK